jgi:hypothetical protein
MSVSDLAQLLTGLGLTINAIVTLLSYVQSRRNGKVLDAVHTATDGLTNRLVAATAKENYAAGVSQGVENPEAPRAVRPDGV